MNITPLTYRSCAVPAIHERISSLYPRSAYVIMIKHTYTCRKLLELMKNEKKSIIMGSFGTCGYVLADKITALLH